MSKFIYTYDVIHVPSGRRIAVGFDNKATAESLAVAAINNRPGVEFKTRQVRKPNPEYVAAL